jgi:hypothetical protein
MFEQAAVGAGADKRFVNSGQTREGAESFGVAYGIQVSISREPFLITDPKKDSARPNLIGVCRAP